MPAGTVGNWKPEARCGPMKKGRRSLAGLPVSISYAMGGLPQAPPRVAQSPAQNQPPWDWSECMSERFSNTGHAVVIAGAGPTGMMLAAELALAGVDVAIVERRTTPTLNGSRAGGLHARTIEVFDQRGSPIALFRKGRSRRSCASTRRRWTSATSDTASLRARAVAEPYRTHPGAVGDELPVTVYRGLEVTGFAQDDSGVDVALSGGRSLRAQYLVGCDGGRSAIRKAAGIAFPGWDPTTVG